MNIKDYYCSKIGKRVRPDVCVDEGNMHFNGRMICSCSVEGRCYTAGVFSDCDLVDQARADVEAWKKSAPEYQSPTSLAEIFLAAREAEGG